MKRLPQAKRNQLIGVVLTTLGLICAVYFLLISPQGTSNRNLGMTINHETQNLQKYKGSIARMAETTSNLNELTLQLDQAEKDVASGDLFEWTVQTMRNFKGAYRVEIPTISQPAASDCDLIANFPYREIRFTVNGTAYYHDLGKFVADFENKFPHCRVLGLSLDPSGNGERLLFRMDIVALVKPNT
jgi:hypothetical protein